MSAARTLTDEDVEAIAVRVAELVTRARRDRKPEALPDPERIAVALERIAAALEGGGPAKKPAVRLRLAGIPCVYFIQAEPDGLIKIGHTGLAPEERLEKLQVGSPVRLRLLHATNGGRDVEEELHSRLGMHRVRGEWFSPSEPVLDAMRALPEFDPWKELGWHV